MNAAPLEPKRWTLVRWLRALALIFALQLGFIFCLSERAPVKARLPHASPAIRIAGPASAQLLLLTDPTLFALPHRSGFSGKAWLKAPLQQAPSLDWSEPTNWLPLAVSQLGTVFSRLNPTNTLPAWPSLPLPEPPMKPSPVFAGNSAPVQSALRIEGTLAQRRLHQALELRAWPRTDLLTNTIVQLVVDREGRPVSVPVLLTSSGDKEADAHALEQARAARFEPSTSPAKLPLSELSWGELIFQWAIVPPAATNAPSSTANPQ